MSDEQGKAKTIRWHGDGIYSKTRRGRDGESVETFYVRVWIPSERKMLTWKAGHTPRQAERKQRQVQGDPDGAAAKRASAREAQKAAKSAAYTVAQLFDAFTAGYRSRGRTGFHGKILDASQTFMGSRPAASVTRALLDAYVTERESVQRKDGGGRRVSDSTIRKELIGIGTAYRWGKAQGLVQSNPADAENMPRPKETFDEARSLTDDEYSDVRSVSAPWLRNVIAWAAETGMDKGKVRRLRWQELDLERADGRIVAGRFAMQRDKTGKPVRQVLSEGAVEVLNRAAKVRHASGIVFLGTDGQPIEEKALDWALGCAYKAAGIAGCNFRTLRHSFATRALRRGVPVPVLAKMMGHGNSFITERYMHVADDQLQAAAQAMSGPERLTGRDRIPPAMPPTGAPTGAGFSDGKADVA
jgi:integrase